MLPDNHYTVYRDKLKIFNQRQPMQEPSKIMIERLKLVQALQYKGYSYREIGDMLGLSFAQVIYVIRRWGNGIVR